MTNVNVYTRITITSVSSFRNAVNVSSRDYFRSLLNIFPNFEKAFSRNRKPNSIFSFSLGIQRGWIKPLCRSYSFRGGGRKCRSALFRRETIIAVKRTRKNRFFLQDNDNSSRPVDQESGSRCA